MDWSYKAMKWGSNFGKVSGEFYLRSSVKQNEKTVYLLGNTTSNQ